MAQGADRAESSLPGMISLAAAALLAATGAGLFVGVGDQLSQTAHSAGQESLSAARTTVQFQSVVGRILGGGSALDALNVTITLGPGSDPVALELLVMVLANQTAERTLAHGGAPNATRFNATAVRDADGSVAGTQRLNRDDLVTLNADLSASGANLLLPVREPLAVALLPYPGLPARVGLVAPATYAGQTVVTLR